MQNSYIHEFIADYAGAVPHYDGGEYLDGGGFLWDHNTIDLDQDQTGCINFTAFNGDITGAVVTNNLIRGGTYCLYFREDGANQLTGAIIDNNRFGRTQQFGVLSADAITYVHAPTGNVYDDDNSSVL